MVDISVHDGKLVLRVEGWDKLWSFKSSVEIPLEHVLAVRADPMTPLSRQMGIRAPGTSLPGIITAGTFYQEGKRVFWDVHHTENTMVIVLKDERYDELIVEVADPQAAVHMIRSALQR